LLFHRWVIKNHRHQKKPKDAKAEEKVEPEKVVATITTKTKKTQQDAKVAKIDREIPVV
jgi:hypothetical protein